MRIPPNIPSDIVSDFVFKLVNIFLGAMHANEHIYTRYIVCITTNHRYRYVDNLSAPNYTLLPLSCL